MEHITYMNRCLELSMNGLGTTYPNPLVGSIIVSDKGIIIGEGFHLKSGCPHAEVNAINQAERRGYSIKDFTTSILYVNLEPCSHHGKTPPCAELIVKKGFKNVVIGTLDPHLKVAGNGVKILQAAGINVTVGILEEKCNKTNKRFFTYHKYKRPYIFLKWAQTADGFIAPLFKKSQSPVWITNRYSRQWSHKLRSRENAILIGAHTAVDDNPSLTVRDWAGENPIRIVLDSRDELPEDLNIFKENAVVQILRRSSQQSHEIVEDLYHLGIQSVIIEGGAATLQSFIDQKLWDEIYKFVGEDTYFQKGLAAPHVSHQYSSIETQRFLNDTLKIYTR